MESQNGSVEAYLEQVEQQRVVLADIKKEYRNSLTNNVIELMFRADVNNDHTIDAEEVDGLMDDLKSLCGITFDREKFRGIVNGSGGSLECVIRTVKTMMDRDNEAYEKGNGNKNSLFANEDDDSLSDDLGDEEEGMGTA
uniref:Uncharacterized protein n=1 Tax=Trieres chinensis TaxID=1514140 RepID=A0A7S1ZT44_TRICV|mmetsp:Transcript_32579/g.66596  ORF Transcript_32579/g.66596 Transcript_32579/m.66596 type:complete len:140 (+) Transcript_32579:1-420(+)